MAICVGGTAVVGATGANVVIKPPEVVLQAAMLHQRPRRVKSVEGLPGTTSLTVVSPRHRRPLRSGPGAQLKRSVRVLKFLRPCTCPTTQQFKVAVHAAPERSLFKFTPASGLATIDQALPSQCSVSV